MTQTPTRPAPTVVHAMDADQQPLCEFAGVELDGAVRVSDLALEVTCSLCQQLGMIDPREDLHCRSCGTDNAVRECRDWCPQMQGRCGCGYPLCGECMRRPETTGHRRAGWPVGNPGPTPGGVL